MSTPLTIPKNPAYPPSMDWTRLRREGIRHIERLGSSIWTDYNLHDPGITLLEILCYAITDLGYRVNLDAKDLFAGSSDNAFLTTRQILPNGPVTALDYRKLLIDIPGVKNAWVEQMDEPEIRFYLKDITDNEAAELSNAINEYYNNLYQEILDEPLSVDFSGISFTEQLGDGSGILDLLAEMECCKSNPEQQEVREKLADRIASRIMVSLASGNGDDDYTVLFPLVLEVIHFYPERVSEELMREFGQAEAAERKLLEIVWCLHELLVEFSDLKRRIAQAKNAEKKRLQERLVQLVGDRDAVGSIKYILLTQPQELDLDLDEQTAKRLIYLILEGLTNTVIWQSLATEKYQPPETGEQQQLYYNLFLPKGIYKASLDLEDGAEIREDDIKREAKSILLTNRNLSEDIVPEIQIVEKKDMGIDLDLILDPAVDELEVLTNVYYAIHKYLIPDVRFYSLEQMLNKYAGFSLTEQGLEDLADALVPSAVTDKLRIVVGDEFIGLDPFTAAIEVLLDVDEWEEYQDVIVVASQKRYDADKVYQGPLLRHGFLDEDELLASQPRQTVYRSDLYRLIAGVEGVEGIKKLRVFAADGDKSRKRDCKATTRAKTESIDWCLEFECRCLPRLDLSDSCISIDKGAGSVAVDPAELALYVAVNPPLSSKVNREKELDLTIPEGTVYQDLTDFTSVQEDFPRTYKIGSNGISSKETPLRKAQAKQLQAYLLFYDQLLANYLSHLANVQNLLALDAQEGRSFQPLYDLAGIKDLLVAYDPSTNWEAFTEDQNNGYYKALEELATGNHTQAKLYKNRLLDHLLARFGEQFTENVLQLYRIDRPVDRDSLLEGNLHDWTIDKQRLLDHIPQLTAGRGLGFNYRPEDGSGLWKIRQEEAFTAAQRQLQLQAVSGLKQRVCAHLGIDDWTRHTITCEPDFQVDSRLIRGTGTSRAKYMIVVQEKGAKTRSDRLLISTSQFSSEAGAEGAMQDFLRHAASKKHYDKVDDRVGFWLVEEARTLDNALFLDPKLEPQTADARLERLVKLAANNCQDDSFHIIEHILLRPKNEIYRKTLQPLVSCLDCLELIDPYSFWITVVVPEWVDRFSNTQQLYLFEQQLRMEAPAHLMIRVVPLDRDLMLKFETLYSRWLVALCEDSDQLPKLTDELVTQMNQWTSI